VRAIVAAYPFDGVARAAILALKYRQQRRLARLLAPGLIAALANRPLGVDVVMPVPLSRARATERGFNQSALLARPVAQSLGLPIDTTSLVRTRNTAQQTSLPARERRTNMVGAFAVSEPRRVVGLRILLVDDVCTTGATIESCANTLLHAGASGVWALVLARDEPGLQRPR